MKKIFKAFFTVTLISVLTRFISFIFKIYISRKLGAEIMGVYQICLSVFMLFVSISASGLPVTLSRFTAESEARGDLRGQSASVSTCLIISLMISLGICTLFYCFPSLLNYIFTDERCAKLFLILLPTMATTSIYTVSRAWFWGKKQFFIYSSTEAADEIIKIIVCCIFMSCLSSVIALEYTLAYAMLISDCIIAVILVIMFFAKGGKLSSPAMCKPIVKSAAPLTITRMCGSLMTTFMSFAIPALLIAFNGLSNSQATAELGRASGMVMPLILAPSSVIGSLAVVIIPEIASRKHTDGKSINHTISRALNFTCIVSSVTFFIFAGCGEVLGYMLYSDELVGKYLVAAAAIVFPICLNGIVTSMLNSFGKEHQSFIGHVVGYIFLTASVLITPRYIGIYGYFVSLFIFHSVTLCVNFVFLSRQTSLKLSSFTKCLIPVSASVVLAVLVRVCSKLMSPTGKILSCIIPVTVAAIIMYAVLALTKMLPSPPAILNALKRKE